MVEEAEAECFLVVLRERALDQARILSALSDGATYPADQCHERSAAGRSDTDGGGVR